MRRGKGLCGGMGGGERGYWEGVWEEGNFGLLGVCEEGKGVIGRGYGRKENGYREGAWEENMDVREM